MTAAGLAGKAGRIPAVVRDGLRYPALRLQAQTRETAVEALAGVGFDAAELRAHEREFEALAPGLYGELATAARRAGSREALVAAERVQRPSVSSREAKKLLYLSVRAVRPQTIAETGPFNGASSAFLLRALEDNGRGRLLSFDIAAPVDALGVAIPPGCEPGWLVPASLRARFELVLGDTRRTLAARLEAAAAIDLFVHDSLHTARQMLFEYRVAWRRLRRGGLLLSDDVFWNPAFWLFTKRHRAPFRHIGTMGVTRKR
jgi:predicted O-methyltransferase YrrM